MIWRLAICSKAARLGFLLWLTAAAAFGASVLGQVKVVSSQDPNVRKHLDYSGIVIWLEPLSGTPVTTASTRKVEMVQKNKKFTPHILPIAVGTTVDFPNYDPIFHNAFSNYDGQLFDVGLYPPGTSRSVTFKRAGVVRVFCNIHPAMSAIILVVNSPYFGVTDTTGVYEIHSVPAGRYRLHVFHERATEDTLASLSRVIEVADGPTSIPLITVSESGFLPRGHKNKYGMSYPPASDGRPYAGEKP